MPFQNLRLPTARVNGIIFLQQSAFNRSFFSSIDSFEGRVVKSYAEMENFCQVGDSESNLFFPGRGDTSVGRSSRKQAKNNPYQ